MASRGDRIVGRWIGAFAERVRQWSIATPERRARLVARLEADHPELGDGEAAAVLAAVGWWFPRATWCCQTARKARRRGVDVTAIQIARGLN